MPGSGGATDTLFLHWNGTKWSQVTAPSPSAGTNFLQAATAVSPSDALAVGTEATPSRWPAQSWDHL